MGWAIFHVTGIEKDGANSNWLGWFLPMGVQSHEPHDLGRLHRHVLPRARRPGPPPDQLANAKGRIDENPAPILGAGF